ncbi:helix-turn-helix domain-containing protein [Maribacter sp. R77961]|uniref:helix-turn-helix domain-containing protein n=1 Tax=Maribacter sp. R77961 TaxID=3093871 RepID=UPI0037CB8B5D
MESKQVYLYPISPQELTDQMVTVVDEKLTAFISKHPSIGPRQEELLTVEETMNFLKCSKQALWNWRKKGILPSFRLGNRVYYKKTDIFSKLIKQD